MTRKDDTPQLILASTSVYRKAQMESLSVAFKAASPKADEEKLKAEFRNNSPLELCRHLALEKAKSLKADHPRSFIIGADQLVSFKDEILGKAGSAEKAVDQLLRLQGQTHELITCMAIVGPEDFLFQHDEVMTMKMRALLRPELTEYVERDQTWDCAGSYKYEKNGAALMQEVPAGDISAITGLPLEALRGIIKELI